MKWRNICFLAAIASTITSSWCFQPALATDASMKSSMKSCVHHSLAGDRWTHVGIDGTIGQQLADARKKPAANEAQALVFLRQYTRAHTHAHDSQFIIQILLLTAVMPLCLMLIPLAHLMLHPETVYEVQSKRHRLILVALMSAVFVPLAFWTALTLQHTALHSVWSVNSIDVIIAYTVFGLVSSAVAYRIFQRHLPAPQRNTPQIPSAKTLLWYWRLPILGWVVLVLGEPLLQVQDILGTRYAVNQSVTQAQICSLRASSLWQRAQRFRAAKYAGDEYIKLCKCFDQIDAVSAFRSQQNYLIKKAEEQNRYEPAVIQSVNFLIRPVETVRCEHSKHHTTQARSTNSLLSMFGGVGGLLALMLAVWPEAIPAIFAFKGRNLLADKTFAAVIAVKRFTLRPANPMLINSYMMVGDWAMAGNNLPGAKKYFLDALSLSESLLGNDERTAEIMYKLSQAYIKSGDFEASKKLLNKALTMTGQDWTSYWLCSLYNDLSHVEMQLGHILSSRAYSEKSLIIARSNLSAEMEVGGQTFHPPGQPAMAVILVQMCLIQAADNLLLIGRYAEALELIEDANQMQKENLITEKHRTIYELSQDRRQVDHLKERIRRVTAFRARIA